MNNSIRPIDRTLSLIRCYYSGRKWHLGAMATKGFSIFFRAPLTGALPSDRFVSYLEHSLGGSFNPLQLVYFTATADWAPPFFFWRWDFPLQRCCRYILEPKSTGGYKTCRYSFLARDEKVYKHKGHNTIIFAMCDFFFFIQK